MTGRIHVSHNGQDLGGLQVDYNLNKTYFVAESLQALETLLRLKPEDNVEVENLGVMPFFRYRQIHLEEADAIYPSVEAWASRSIRGATKDIIKKFIGRPHGCSVHQRLRNERMGRGLE